MDILAVSLRAAYPKALATLIRLLGDLDSAEDALQEALLRALEGWPEKGLPDNPVAWLVTTGRNHAIDLLRKHNLESRYALSSRAEVNDVHSTNENPDSDLGLHFDDDLLRLIFTCCHPALAKEVQVALTLKTVAGLTVEEIARAYLVPPKTMEQRITRAKRKIRDARIPYEVPAVARLPERLDAVLVVIYLIFSEGYNSSSSSQLIRTDLCWEAIRLARLVSRLFRSEAEATGLLALLLLQHSRRNARLDEQGNIIPLDEQDRGLWDRGLIAEGRALLEKALRQKRPDPYQIQAAIAAIHCEADRAEETDWAQITDLYRILERHQPSPVVTVNRAVAVAKTDGPRAAIALLRTIEDSPEIQRYHHFHAAMGALQEEVGEGHSAVAAYEKALSLTQNPSERGYINKKIRALK